MIITKIERQVKHKERYNVYIDEVFYCGVHEATLIKYNLFNGRKLNQQELAHIVESDLLEGLYLRAIRYLSHSLRSRQGVAQKIMRDQIEKMDFKDYDERENYQQALKEKVEQIIQRLETEGYINDRYYGECYVRTEAIVGRKGPERIRAGLQKKGLTDTLINQVLESAYDNQMLQANMEEVSRKFIKKNHKLPTKVIPLKLRQYLQQKGYSRQEVADYILGLSLESDDGDEQQKIAQAGEKVLRTYRKKYASSILWIKTKEALYRKGFDYGLIQEWVEWQQTQEDGD